jgi:hypothetical protein
MMVHSTPPDNEDPPFIHTVVGPAEEEDYLFEAEYMPN